MLSTHSVFLYKASIVAEMSMGDRYPAASARNSPNSVITVYRCEIPSLTFPDGVCFRRWQKSAIFLVVHRCETSNCQFHQLGNARLTGRSGYGVCHFSW